MSKPVTLPTSSGPVTGTLAPASAPTPPDQFPMAEVVGLTFANSSTTNGATVIVRDGGASGTIVAGGTVPAATAAQAIYMFDEAFIHPRQTINGLYVQVAGTITGVIWVK